MTFLYVLVFQSEAQQLEMARLTKSGGGVGTGSREERLKRAATLHMQVYSVMFLLLEMVTWESTMCIIIAS